MKHIPTTVATPRPSAIAQYTFSAAGPIEQSRALEIVRASLLAVIAVCLRCEELPATVEDLVLEFLECPEVLEPLLEDPVIGASVRKLLRYEDASWVSGLGFLELLMVGLVEVVQQGGL